jgi:hypothetical protein
MGFDANARAHDEALVMLHSIPGITFVRFQSFSET